MKTETEKTEEKQKIKELVDKGLKNKEIGKILGMKYRTVCFKLREYKLIRYSKPQISQEKIDEMIRLYNEGYNCTEICEKINISKITISFILKENGIKIVKRSADSKPELRLLRGEKCIICDRNLGPYVTICSTCVSQVRRYKIKKKMFDFKGGKCEDCGDDSLCVDIYDFHHLDPDEKDFNLSKVLIDGKSWDDIEKELKKCALLCSNCHRIRHSVERKSEKFWKYIKLIS